MHYRFQIQPEGRAGLSEKCLTQRLWIQVFSSISNWASKTIKNLLYKLKARGYQLLFKDLQPLGDNCPALPAVIWGVSWSPVLWADQRQKRGKDGEDKSKRTGEERRAGTKCGSPGMDSSNIHWYMVRVCRVLHPPLAHPRWCSRRHRHQEKHVWSCRMWEAVDISSNREVQKVGRHQCTLANPRSCCPELVYCVVILSVTRTHSLRLGLRQNKMDTTNQPGPT